MSSLGNGSVAETSDGTPARSTHVTGSKKQRSAKDKPTEDSSKPTKMSRKMSFLDDLVAQSQDRLRFLDLGYAHPAM